MSHVNEEKEEITIYRQYLLNEFPDNTSSDIKHVDYILGIATEEYLPGLDQGNGKFSWKNPSGLSPEKVQDIKDKYKNVRIILSIGGSGERGRFEPIAKNKWIENALESIKHIVVDRYNNQFDGIDINYDFIKTSEDDFTSYIGDFLRQLKVLVPAIKVVSIAPSKDNNSVYYKLYSSNKSIIRLVGYQYYREKIHSVNEGINIFNVLKGKYADAKVLPGLNTPPDSIIQGVIQKLKEDKKIVGYFVWNAAAFNLAPRQESFLFDEILQ